MQRVRTFKIKAMFNVAFLYTINFEGFMMNNMMFDIQGMKTGVCINRVYEALDHIDGLTNISVSLWSGQVVISKNPNEMRAHAGSFDFIINTVAASHDLNPFLQLLKRDGTMCMIGVPDHPHPPVDTASLIFQRRSLAGSLIGGIKETQEMLDFAAKHDIVCDIEMIAMKEINQAFDRVVRSDVKYRFVIDMATLA